MQHIAARTHSILDMFIPLGRQTGFLIAQSPRKGVTISGIHFWVPVKGSRKVGYVLSDLPAPPRDLVASCMVLSRGLRLVPRRSVGMDRRNASWDLVGCFAGRPVVSS